MKIESFNYFMIFDKVTGRYLRWSKNKIRMYSSMALTKVNLPKLRLSDGGRVVDTPERYEIHEYSLEATHPAGLD